MREIVDTFQKGFSVGLRPSEAVGTNFECLVECYNMVPEKTGLEPREEIVLLPLMNQEFPFPCYFIGSSYVLLFTHNMVYYLDGEWNPVFLFQEEWGSIPHIADFQTYIVWATERGMWQYDGEAVTKLNEWSGTTCCNFRGQLLVGNAKLPKGPLRTEDGAIIEQSVETPSEGLLAWGVIGDSEFRYQLGLENGWIQLPFLGRVYSILPLENRVFVYHQNGVTRLQPVQEPTPTFGIDTFAYIGPLNPWCVAGDDLTHLMLGSDYHLYRVVPERAMSQSGRSLEDLDYEEWMRHLINPIMAFDKVRGHWWIGDENRCFIYNGAGLSEASITPTMLGRFNGQLYGAYVEHGPDNAIATINTTSLNSRDLKTLMVVESDIRAPSGAIGQVRWRADYSKPMRDTPVKRLDPRGFFFPVVSGSELEVKIETSDYRKTHLSKLWLRYKTTDKTSIRGIIYAGTPSQQ